MKPSEYRQGDTLFMIRRFPPFEAMRVLGELQKVLAPLLGGAAKGATGANIDADIRSVSAWAGILGNAITELPKHLDGEKFEALSRMLLRTDYVSVSQDGTKENLIKLSETVIDEVFEGRPFDMIALMIAVVKVNYLDFSRLSSVPTGVREAFSGVMNQFQETHQTNLGE